MRERELEMQAAEARVNQLDHLLCPHCDYDVENDFLRCPSCLRKLKDPCANCARPLDPAWRSARTARHEVAGALRTPAAPAPPPRERPAEAYEAPPGA